jgi:hypothetical protein
MGWVSGAVRKPVSRTGAWGSAQTRSLASRSSHWPAGWPRRGDARRRCTHEVARERRCEYACGSGLERVVDEVGQRAQQQSPGRSRHGCRPFPSQIRQLVAIDLRQERHRNAAVVFWPRLVWGEVRITTDLGSGMRRHGFVAHVEAPTRAYGADQGLGELAETFLAGDAPHVVPGQH